MSGIDSLRDVAIRPWPANKNDELSKDALLRQIEQLTTERGHLRDITEQTLQADIDAGKDVLGNVNASLEEEEEEEDEKEAPSRKEQMEQIFKMQMEMAGHLEYD